MATLPMQPNSKRTARRKKRGFKSLEVSCRKHRRAARRSSESRSIAGRVKEAGEKGPRETVSGGAKKGFIHTAGGSLKYHCS
jgi:hypothetical protein